MRLKLLLKDDPLLQQELLRCNNPDEVIRFAERLQLEVNMADLLRMEALMTLTLTDQELSNWYITPYWKRVLASLGAINP